MQITGQNITQQPTTNTRKEFLTPHIMLEMLRIEQSRGSIVAAAAA
jgi:hypothetical protein